MATINLGAIKFNWKGAYAGGTAYTVDDVVSSGGSSYVCILASTGNAVSNATYWSIMAQTGTDGTDLTTTLTTEGDTVYKGASALTRLAKGTTLQQLRMNAGATAPEWFTASGGGLLQIKRGTRTTTGTFDSSSAYASFGCSVAITPTAADSSFYINATPYAAPSNHDTPFKYNISDSQVGATTAIFTDVSRSHSHLGSTSHFGVGAFGGDSAVDDYWFKQMTVGGMYTPSSNNGSARTFDIIAYNSSNGSLHINQSQINPNTQSSGGVSTIEVWEIANGIYS